MSVCRHSSRKTTVLPFLPLLEQDFLNIAYGILCKSRLLYVLLIPQGILLSFVQLAADVLQNRQRLVEARNSSLANILVPFSILVHLLTLFVCE